MSHSARTHQCWDSKNVEILNFLYTITIVRIGMLLTICNGSVLCRCVQLEIENANDKKNRRNKTLNAPPTSAYRNESERERKHQQRCVYRAHDITTKLFTDCFFARFRCVSFDVCSILQSKFSKSKYKRGQNKKKAMVVWSAAHRAAANQCRLRYHTSNGCLVRRVLCSSMAALIKLIQ